MSIEGTYPPKVAAALDLIRAECLREEWLTPADLPDRDSTYRYVTDSVYLPEPCTGYGKPGAGMFEDHGDASAYAYLIVLGYEWIQAAAQPIPGDQRTGDLDQRDVLRARELVKARTGTPRCSMTRMPHRIGGTVLAPICIDCEILR